MRVLHLSSGNLYGGVEVMLATLARERGNCPGMEPHFALCFPGRLSEELAALGSPPTLFGPVKVRFPWQIWQARRRLAALLAKHTFDAVICHMPWNLAIFGPVVRRAGLPLVFWMHDRAKGQHWIERWASRVRPDLAICNSRFTSDSLGLLFPGRTPPHIVIHCPVSPSVVEKISVEKRKAIRQELHTSPDAVVIIQVSRMEPYKGHTLHLEALGQLRDVPGWTCWIVGGAQRPHEQAYLAELEAQATTTGIAGRVRFLGERTDVTRLLSASDIFCQPNLRGEPFGLVFIEALQAGLPVVTAALGGALEIVDETCGRLIEPDSPAHLAAALRQLITDADLREKLGRPGPARAAHLCSPMIVLPQLANALTAICPGHTPDSSKSPNPEFAESEAPCKASVDRSTLREAASRFLVFIMRSETDLAKLESFMRSLSKRVSGPGRIYLTGGATALLRGWRTMTIDVDLKPDPEPAGLYEAIAALKDELDINVELAAPDQFIPALPAWRDRSLSIARHGPIEFFHYDLYSQALAKLQRSHARDLDDVQNMLRDRLVERDRLWELFQQIAPQLIRFPAIEPQSFRQRVRAFCEIPDHSP